MTTTTQPTNQLPNRTRPYRLTVDLDGDMRHGLRLWCLNSGLPNASQAGVLRALADRLLNDAELSAAITADLAAQT